ncbi:MAG: extracellular solute-binding protein [Aigarchaeota archaeon]|nr:extracellular solute-binding protein [Candidatus Pelearchaeum maunauluense]
MSSQKVSRRKFIAIAGGAVIVAAAAGLAYTTLTTPQQRTLRYSTHPFYFPQDAEQKFEEGNQNLNVEVTYEEFFVMTQKQLANPQTWDVASSGRYRIIIDAGIVRPIPVEKIPRWQPDKVLRIFQEPQRFLKDGDLEETVKRFNKLIWFEPNKVFSAVPIMWNFDSLTYLPEMLPYQERGAQYRDVEYGELWNPEWKGHTAMQDEAFTVFTEVANYLDATKQITITSAITNLSQQEVDQIYDYLLPIVKDGFIKTFWFKYGDIVSLMSTREIWIASTWQPVSFDTRKAGTPAYYAALKHGPFFWYNSTYVSKMIDDATAEEAMKLVNWQLSLFTQLLYTRQGYPTPAYGWDDYKNAMGDEFYDWFYNGKATYLPIDEVLKITFPDKPDLAELPERLQQALFVPDLYFKHFWVGEPPRTGSPHPKGNIRDLGSVQEKEEMTRYFLSPDLPDNNDYYVKKYEELKALVPK